MDNAARIEFSAKSAAPLLRPTPIPWPTTPGAPRWVPLDPVPQPTDALPVADALVVTYTQAEGEALADVLTPNHQAHDWTAYNNGWSEIQPMLSKYAPAQQEGCAGRWALCQIGSLRVVLVKSNLHPSTDGPQLPMTALWTQMIGQVQPRLVITTGTAGAVGAEMILGDVVVTDTVRWDATTKFKSQAWAQQTYTSSAGHQILASALVQDFLTECEATLFKANASQLPAASRGPLVFDSVVGPVVTVTTDFFAFDDVADHFKLRSAEPNAHAVEMDDAALGLACAGMSKPPAWLSVRNASDPQMSGTSVKAEDKQAASIYRRFGYTTTVMSAVACYAVLAGMDAGSNVEGD